MKLGQMHVHLYCTVNNLLILFSVSFHPNDNFISIEYFGRLTLLFSRWMDIYKDTLPTYFTNLIIILGGPNQLQSSVVAIVVDISQLRVVIRRIMFILSG